MKKIILFLIISITLVFIFHPWNINDDNYADLEVQPSCSVEERKMTVRGDSMTPFLVSDDEVRAFFGYYACHDVLRNDIVLYKYSGNENLLIKFVRAIPGDRWNLRQEGFVHNIIVNDSVLLNSAGNPYLIPDTSVKMLQLYIKDYPVIPENTYLLLGDKTDGSLDSTAFGLVGKDDIMAKVEI